MSGWYSSTVNCYTVTHKSIHQFPTNLHQPSPTFTNLRRPGQRICANVAAHDVRFPANSRRPSTGWPVVQLHDTLPVCWLGKLPTIHPWILWSYWDGLLLDLPTSKMDHIKNNCTLGFLLDHWIIGSLDHIPEGSLVQVTWSISGAGVPIMNQKNWAKCPNQTNKLGFSITSPTPFFQSQPHGRDLEKIPLNSLDGTVGSPLGTLFSRKMVMTARNCGSTCFWKMKYMTSNPKTKNKSSCSIQTKTTESTAGGIPSTCKLSIGEKKTQKCYSRPLA